MEKVASYCPWGFLDGLGESQSHEKNTTTTVNTTNIVEPMVVAADPIPRSYDAVPKPKYGRNVDTSLLPTPGKQGEFPTISLIEEEVDKGIEH
ncbi:hypothetical protein IFM89_026524 [Coptis chinensis]|uniref:Uncharacterized protein n=1 Tax=Coptis chinensis TaxID=261450 RepID=A0A835IF65_9MAGN|nr:hypothetical protein IFM89_026524 [Coptis chinensis]